MCAGERWRGWDRRVARHALPSIAGLDSPGRARAVPRRRHLSGAAQRRVGFSSSVRLFSTDVGQELRLRLDVQSAATPLARRLRAKVEER